MTLKDLSLWIVQDSLVLLVGIWPWSCAPTDVLAVFPPSVATPFFTFAGTFSSYFSFIFITHQEPSYMCSESCYAHQQPNCQIPGPFSWLCISGFFNICYLHFEYHCVDTPSLSRRLAVFSATFFCLLLNVDKT